MDGGSQSLCRFSIDMYHMDGPVVGWVDQNVRHVYTTQIYPNLTARQSVMLVPYVCSFACLLSAR